MQIQLVVVPSDGDLFAKLGMSLPTLFPLTGPHALNQARGSVVSFSSRFKKSQTAKRFICILS